MHETILAASDQIFLGSQVSVVGTILLLGAYALMQFGVIKTESYLYQWGNGLGAACLAYSVIKPFNVGVFITESVWTLISIYGIIKTFQVLHSKKSERNLG